MQSTRATEVLAQASSALVADHDVADFLATLLSGCHEVLAIDAGGILVEVDGRLELLAASTHDAVELELHQAQLVEGPCVEAYATGEPVEQAGRAEIEQRWAQFGPVMTGAGFASIHASPLRWHGATLGAMGLFRRSAAVFDAEETAVAQAFADLATLLIIQIDRIDLDDVARQVERALTSRVLIEQAKGVLAEFHGGDMAEAYRRLLESSRNSGDNLTVTARLVLDRARDR